MSEPHVTAVVLLSGSTTAHSLSTALEAVTGQSRHADRLVVVATSDLSDDVQDALDAQVADGVVDDVVTISASAGPAGAVREAADLLSRGSRESGRAPAADVDAGDIEDTARPSRRRARKVDRTAIEKRRTQQAEDLARIPQRLRTRRSRPGRRVGLGGGADSESWSSWLWFVVDGSTPGPTALEHQLRFAAESPNTGVVGAKRVRPMGPAPDGDGPDRDGLGQDGPGQERLDHDQLDHDRNDESAPGTAPHADALVDVGITLTHGGRIITGVDPGEIDQGQADWRQDVLAVALPGMLIREQTLRDVGGLDPDLPAPWAEIDLCRRVWRSGERVAVQSAATVLYPAPTRPGLERLQEQRTGQILVLLKHRSLLMALAMLLVLPLSTMLRMAGAVAASAPRRAGMELRAWIAALARAPRVLGRGLRERRRARVPSGRLAPLYLPRGEGARRLLDDTWTRLVADDDRIRRIRRTTWGVAGTRHGIEDADYGRHLVWTVVVALTATVLGLTALRRLFGRGELTGPGLRAIPESWGALWEAAWSSWIPGGLGERGPGDPLVRLLGHLPLGGSLFIEIVVFAAVPVSALAAWWAAGAVTRAVGARLALTTAWAVAPSLLAALAAGAWPLLLVHMLLPLIALSIGRAVGLPHKVSQASISAAAIGGLLLLVAGAIQPVLVLLGAVALVLIALGVPGRRARLLWVLLPSLALHAPYLPVYLGHPRTLLAVGGMPARAGTASTTDLLSLWPVAPGLQDALAPQLGGPGGTIALLAPVLPVAPVILAAIFSPLLAGQAGRVGRFSVLMAAVSLLTVLLARETPTALGDEQLVTAPLHGLLSVTLLLLCLGAAASFDALARREPGDGRLRRLLTSITGAAVAAVCLVTVVGGTALLPGQLRVDRVEGGEVPAAAADQGRTSARARVLVLKQEADGSVGASVVVHGGDTVIQHAAIDDARHVETVRSGNAPDEDPGSTALRGAVAEMLSSGADAAASDEVQQATATLAVAYVVVEGDPEQQAELMRTLDTSSTFEKVTEGARGGMWRVIDSAPRARVTGGDEPVALDSGVIGAEGTVPAARDERTVVLAERYDTQWEATLEGTELEPVVVDGWAQGFTVPPGTGGDIDIHREQPFRLLWQVGLYAVLALTALIAIPWRVRPRAAEEMYG
ncbi:hypothetical protein ACFQRD_13710 [Brachybacterium sp. GCM10030268]|uniref:hypothetical protein n=1 Tax=Brachybacterium sp. GCM10030268 TaxID=3273382 RepID=UPI00360F3522